jgi:LuxR family transcriptional regulator, maltose regulon positive regulatory protein
MILRHKVRRPGPPRGAIARTRLDELVDGMLERHEVVALIAAAGSGKTAQTTLYAARSGRLVAWLTLDARDRGSRRLLTYLAEALSDVAPQARAIAARLDSEDSVEEVAATLAECIPEQPLLLVIDDGEHLAGADEALEALGVFLDYLPTSVRTILMSRQDVGGPLARMTLHGRLARIGDEDLALRQPEAAALLAAHGHDVEDPAAIAELVAATGGWIAAVAFDLAPGMRHADAEESLAQYLNREVLARLPADEQEFLMRTSIAAAVGARVATALGGERGYALWHAVSARHLPATKVDRAVVYHPRFREFLRAELEARLPGAVAGLVEAHARLLDELGVHEEAVEGYLEVGLLDDAAAAAEKASGAVYKRADWAVLERWLERLGREQIARRPALQGAAIRALYGSRRIPECLDLIRRLHAEGTLGRVAAADPGSVAFVGYAMQWYPLEALELIRHYEGDYRAETVRFELEAASGRDPVSPPPGVEWTDSERMFTWGLLVQGRLQQLLQLLPAALEWPPRSTLRTPHPLMALIWRGELDRVRTLFDEVPEAVRRGSHRDLWYFYECWLLWGEGDLERALWAAEAAVDISSKTRFGWEPCFEVAVGYMQLGLRRHDDARVTLADALSRSAASGNRCYVEWAQAFQGLAFLSVDRTEDAARVLRSAVTGMRRARRLLMLPFAAAYLAEAEARLGDLAASDAAAQVALSGSLELGTTFVLQRALQAVPDVLARQLDTARDTAPWRRMPASRPLTVRGARRTAEAAPVAMDVQTFGSGGDILIDGAPCGVRRTKLLELAAYMTLHPGGVERQRLQDRIFPETDPRRGGNYFRQVVHKLRRATGFSLDRTADGLVRWPAAVRVDSTDLRFDRLLGEAAGLPDAERLARLEDLLSLATGPYLVDSDLEWAEQRRHELEIRVVEASIDAAGLALRIGRPERARQAASFAISRDPYCEEAYRVRMQVEAMLNAPHAVLGEFQRLTAALGEIGVEPAPTTRRLLQQLRATP